MSWRLRFSDRPIVRVDLLAGDPALVAVAGAPQAIHFYGTATGADHGSLRLLSPPAQSEPGSPAWRAYLERLRAPNGTFLPVVDVGSVTIHTSRDGLLHLFQFHDGRLLLDVDGQVAALTRPGSDGTLEAAALDQELGTVGVLDDRGWLHLYQQHIYVGGYLISEDSVDFSALMVPDGADFIWVADEEKIQAVNMAGDALVRIARGEATSLLACSPDGQLLLEADGEAGRVTAYDNNLHPILRSNVLDLLTNAAPVQLFEDFTPFSERVVALAVANDGDVALALGGTICLTTLDVFELLPRPRLLL